MRRRNTNKGGYFAAFGLGVLVAMVLPVRFILIVAVTALVIAGCSLIRC